MTIRTDSPWTILGIEKTDNATLIRRAYARKLKVLGQEIGPDAFHRLRAARANALEQAATLGDGSSNNEVAPRDLGEGSSGGDADETLFEILEASEDDRADPYEGRRIVEVAPLFETERHRIAAARLQSDMTACFIGLEIGNSVDRVALARLLRHAAMLPRGPRRDIETTCLNALTRGWRKSDGSLDPSRVVTVAPLLREADDAFGWSGDDEAMTATLTAQDADAVNIILDAAEYRSRSARLPAAMRMRPADALAYLARSKRYRALFETAVARRAMPWRLNVPALVAPHLWAYHHRLWRELACLYVAVSLPSLILVAWNGRPDTPVVAGLGVAFVLACLASGLFADRLMFAAALRAVKRADQMGLFDKAKRETYLSTKAKLPTFVFAIYLFLPIYFPYMVVQELYVRLLS